VTNNVQYTYVYVMSQVDFDYSYTASGDSNINVNVRSPYTVATELSMADGSQGSAVISWDPTTRDRQIRFDFGLKNVKTSSLTDRALNFKTAVLRRTVGFAVGYKVTSDRLTSHGELHWDSDTQPDFVYDFAASRTSAQRQQTYDGSLRVSSYLINTDSTFSHRIISDRRFVTEIVLDLVEKLTIRSDLNLAASTAVTHRISIQHPRLSRVRVIFVTFGCCFGGHIRNAQNAIDQSTCETVLCAACVTNSLYRH